MERLRKENDELKLEIQELKNKLSHYTNPQRVKNYQERHKEVISEKKKIYYQNKKKEKLENGDAVKN